MIAVLLPPPLSAPGRVHTLAPHLDEHGLHPVLPEIPDDDRAPYAARYVARASLETGRRLPAEDPRAPLALVAEGGAGPLLGAVGAAQRAAHRPVHAYVFVDAWLPQPGSPTRTDIAARQSPEGTVPDMPEVPEGYLTESLPAVADWPDAPCGYLCVDPAFAHVAKLAGMRGWTVREASQEDAGPALAELIHALR
ncbi:hypothetical protein [Nocardiopsis kunsanensis]|uniref:hypothetical protein n=1 Tax=Nocardiopsis kunsanensis TaxID=141693 RepID=UPI0003722E22|nr:hypothetical protein [Nocardiopsis kunsanensis]